MGTQNPSSPTVQMLRPHPLHPPRRREFQRVPKLRNMERKENLSTITNLIHQSPLDILPHLPGFQLRHLTGAILNMTLILRIPTLPTPKFPTLADAIPNERTLQRRFANWPSPRI